MSESKNIYQRINAVMKEVEYVRKDAKVKGYSAVTHDMVTAILRPHLVNAGIAVQLEQLQSSLLERRDKAAGINMHLYSGDYAVHFVNIDQPEDRVTVTINAHAADNGDKAPGKCASYATKYAMLKLFSLETGENEESRLESVKPVTQVQANSIKKGLGNDDDRITKFCDAYQIESVEALPKSNYDKAMAQIKRSNEAK